MKSFISFFLGLIAMACIAATSVDGLNNICFDTVNQLSQERSAFNRSEIERLRSDIQGKP